MYFNPCQAPLLLATRCSERHEQHQVADAEHVRAADSRRRVARRAHFVRSLLADAPSVRRQRLMKQRCPFVAAVAIFALLGVLIPVTPTLLSISLPFWWVLLLQLLAVAGFAICLEKQREGGRECSWLEVGASRRLLTYGALWLVGLVVFAPLSVLGSDLRPIWVWLAGLTVLSSLALLRVHVVVDHGELQETGVPWWLVLSSRLPLYLLLGLGLCALLVAGISIVYDVVGR